MSISEQKIQKIITRSVDQRKIFGTVISAGKESELLSFSAGNLSDQCQYIIALARFIFFGTNELIGHQKASGSLAYYCPKKNTYFNGTINQIHKPSLPYKLIMRVLKTI